MKNNYIDGKIIEISEKGSWTEAKLKDKDIFQDVILVEKNIILESKDGNIHNIYCNKNINIKTGDYIYLSLKEDRVEKIYKNEDEYKIAIKKEKEKNTYQYLENCSDYRGLSVLVLSLILTTIFNPALKAILYIEPLSEILSNHWFSNIFSLDGCFSNIMLYCLTFLIIFNLLNICFQSRRGVAHYIQSSNIRSIEQTDENGVKFKEVEHSTSYKINLFKQK